MERAEIVAIVFVLASIVAHIYQLQDHLPLWANIFWGVAVFGTTAVYMWRYFLRSKKDS